MQVIKLEGMAVLVFKEPSPGFHRGTLVEYIAFEPSVAIIIGESLIKAAQELKRKE